MNKDIVLIRNINITPKKVFYLKYELFLCITVGNIILCQLLMVLKIYFPPYWKFQNKKKNEAGFYWELHVT